MARSHALEANRWARWPAILRPCLLLVLLLPSLLASGAEAAPGGRTEATPRPGAARVAAVTGEARPRAAVAPRPKPARSVATAPRVRPAQRRAVPVKARPSSKVLPLIVVDAGHGGHDPGAIGPSGTLEKTVTLATAQELARQLRATGRYRVALTRGNDRFVSLDRRISIAATGGAALLVSVHADASTDPRVRGASVYVRPGQPSGSEVVQLPAHRGSARAIARALSRPARPEPGSARLQLAMVASLEDDLPMLSDPTRQARFHVLGALGIPSVLVETGFISNRKDEALLRQPRHRSLIARAIRDAVDDYFAGQGGAPASRT